MELCNCATCAVDVIIAASLKALMSNDEELKNEGARLYAAFYTAYNMWTPSGMKGWLKEAESKGIVKKK